MDELEFGRRLKFLRERGRITITKLSQLTSYDKERLRAFETGRAEPRDWEIQRIAEVLDVKVDYFVGKADPTLETKPAAKRVPANLDFSDFKYFKDAPKSDERREVKPKERTPLPPGLAREIVNLEDERDVGPRLAEASPENPRPVAPPPRAPSKEPSERARSARPPGPAAPSVADAGATAAEALARVQALVDVLIERGVFTAGEYERALRRVRGA